MGQQLRVKAWWGSVIFGAALCAATATTVTLAAGLGQMTVRSQLGQPLVADIELLVRDKRDLAGLSTSIASADFHRKVNMPYVAALGLKATLQTDKDGRRTIRVESVKPVVEPTVILLIALDSPGAQSLRAYNVLLDVPESPRR
jgi:pilus assembly protein FimV